MAAADPSNTQWQRDLQINIDRIGGLAYGFVLAREFGRALEAAEKTISLAPETIWFHTNEAHALMFLDRVDEARAVYLRYMGRNVQDNKSWQIEVLEDFAEMRKAGLGDAELMAKKQVLGFKPAPRLEQVDGEHSERLQK